MLFLLIGATRENGGCVGCIRDCRIGRSDRRYILLISFVVVVTFVTVAIALARERKRGVFLGPVSAAVGIRNDLQISTALHVACADQILEFILLDTMLKSFLIECVDLRMGNQIFGGLPIYQLGFIKGPIFDCFGYGDDFMECACELVAGHRRFVMSVATLGVLDDLEDTLAERSAEFAKIVPLPVFRLGPGVEFCFSIHHA